jgi:hypothetical protein
MSDSTISALVAATLPLTSEAVPCVQGGTNKQAPAAAFGIPVVGSGTPAALAEFQTWIDNSHDPARLLMYLNGAWVELYQIADDGTLTVSAALVLPSDPASDLEAATKHYVDSRVSTAPGALIFRGMIDCSTTPPPDYPDANQGDFYVVSHAGQIGGTSGANVATGDMLLCRVNGTASGSQSGAGLNWVIIQGKIQNAAVGPGTAASGDFAQFDGASGTLLKDGGLSFDTDATMAANSDSRIPSQKAVRAQIGGKRLSSDTPAQGQVWAWDGPTATMRTTDCVGHNLLVNPSFEIWQETTQYTLSSSVNKTHIADFWKASGGNTDGRTVMRIAASASTRPAVKFARQSGSSSTYRFRLAQQFESSEALFLAGKNVTVSYDFFASTGCLMSSGPYVTLYSGTGVDEDIDLRSATPNFPTGGANTTSASMGPSSHGAWFRLYTAAFSIPTNATELAFEIHSGDYTGTAGSDDSFQIANVKMEIGNIGTPFYKPDYAPELIRCQRRYQSTFSGNAPADGVGSNTGEFMFCRLGSGTAAEGAYVPLAGRMYGVPAITLYNPVGAGAGQVHNYTHSGDCTASAADFIGDHGFRITCTGNSGGAPGDWLGVHYIADRRI